MKRVLLFSLFLLFFSVSVSAQTMYVSGLQRITFRTGPGTDHKIIISVKPGDRLELLEQGELWSRCKLTDGKEGWILNRFVSGDVPVTDLYKSLNRKYKRIAKKYASLKKSADLNKTQNQKIGVDLNQSLKEAKDLSVKYELLKSGSANFLKLEADYKKVTTELSQLKNEVKIVNDQLTKKNVWWFFGGAGVLLLGMIIGSSSSKRKNRSSYL